MLVDEDDDEDFRALVEVVDEEIRLVFDEEDEESFRWLDLPPNDALRFLVELFFSSFFECDELGGKGRDLRTVGLDTSLFSSVIFPSFVGALNIERIRSSRLVCR